MAESLSEVSSSMEGLEDEGKKKFKFKAFKSLFGKKKKKEPEDVQEGRVTKPSFSSSSLKPVMEIKVHTPKSSMGAKSISHDSVFCLESEPEKLANKLLLPPGPQRSRPQERFPISRTLPRVTGTDVLGALSRSVGHCDPRSELWVSGSKVAEIPPLQSQRPSISSSATQAKKDFKDLEIDFASDKISKGSPKKFSAQHSATWSKAKAKQEEQHASLATKEKVTTKTKHADRKDHKRDSTGPSIQEQSYNPDSQEKKKTRNQSLSTDAASSTGHSASESHPKRRRRRVKNELCFVEKSPLKSTKEHGKAGSSPTEELPGREHSFLKLYLEKQNTEQNPTAEAAVTTQKMPSDKGNVKGETTAIDVEAQRTPAPQPTPTHVAEFTVNSPPLSREEGVSEGKKKKEKVSLVSRIRGPSTSQEEATVLKTAEAQVCTPPSQVHGEEEEASSLDLQKFLPRKELSLESTTYHKGRHPRGGLRAFSASVSSTTAEDVSMPMSPLPLRRWPNAEEISSDSYSSSEYESSSEVQLGSAHSFQLLWNPQDDDVFLKAGNADAELSKMAWQQSLSYSSQSLGKLKARELSSDSDSSSGDQRSCEMTSAQSFQSLDEFEGCSESASFIIDSASEEKLTPGRYSQALLESEENEVSTESSSYFEKYHSSEDMSSSEEEHPPEPSKQALAQSRDQQEVTPVSRSTPKESSGSAKPVHPVHTSPPIVSPSTQQQPPILGNVSGAQSRPVESLPPSHTVRSWMSPQSEHQAFAEVTAADWGIFMQPPSPRRALKHPVRHTVEQNVPTSTDVSTMGEVASVETLPRRHHSQPPVRPVLEQDISVGPELGVFEESVAAQSPRYPSQPSVGPNIKKEASLGAESAAFEGSHFMEFLPPQHPSQPLLKPFTQHQAFERGVSVDSRLLVQSSQPWMKPQGKQPFSGSESTALEGNSSMEHVPPPLSQPMKQPYQNVHFESETVATKIITMGPLHTKYSTHSLLTPQSQPVSESTSVEGASLVELLPPQPSVKPKFQSQMTRDPVSASTQGGSPMESAPAQHTFQTQPFPKFKQVPTGSDGPEAQGIMPIQPGSSRSPSQLWLNPTFEQISVLPGNIPASWAIPVYPPAPRMPSQPLMGSVVRQSASTGSVNTSIQQVAVEPLAPRNPLQPWPTCPFEQISAPPDQAAKAAWSIPVDPQAPRVLSQLLVESVVQQPISTELVGTSVPQSSSVELLPSRFSFQSRVDPETYVADEGVSAIVKPGRHHSQPPRSTEFKEEVSSDSLGASGEWGIPIEPKPSKYAPHPWLGPESERQASSLEGFAKEGDVYKEAWIPRNPSQSITKQQVQKTPSRCESPSFEGDIPWKPPPPKATTQFLMSSKVKDMSSSLESADDQDSSKKQQGRGAPSQSFVKFMTDQIFVESTAGETAIYGKPVLQNRSRPPRSLLKPKLEEQAFLCNWDEEPQEDTTLKKLPLKQPPQSPRRPRSQEVLSYSKGAPLRWSSSAVDSTQPLGKLDHRQKVSISVSFPEERKRSEGQLPSTQPSQGFDVARSQAPVLSTAYANVPVEWHSPEGRRPPSLPAQASVIADSQQQAYVGSASAATEGIISRKNTGSWSMPKGPDSTKKAMKDTQGYGDFIKSTPTSVTKPGKFISVPAQKAFASTGTYSTEEVPQRRDEKKRSSFLSTSKSDVENVFGVRLRKISQRSGLPEPIAPVVPAGKEQMNKGTPQGSSGGQEKSSQAFSCAQKQGNRPRHEGSFKKLPVFRPPEMISSLKSDYTTEPSWISVAKQRQKGFASHFSKKPRTRAEIRTETKEQKYESKYNPDVETPPKEPEPTTDIPPRMTFSSTVPREEMSRLSKSTKSVAFEDQYKLHPYTRERDTRRSSSVPPKISSPKEPVWFSMAKKKAQAWSQMSDIMQ